MDPFPSRAGLSALAAKYDVHIQSHITESIDEVQFSAALHPADQGRDSALFERYGLLTSKARPPPRFCDARLKTLPAPAACRQPEASSGSCPWGPSR